MKTCHAIWLAVVFSMLPVTDTLAELPKPVKAFILAGQSNMEGHGFVAADSKRNGGRGSLEFVVKDAATAPRFQHLVDKDGKWIVRDDVWISYLDRNGPLTVGFGANHERIGPELGFGNVVGDAFDEPVLLRALSLMKVQAAVAERPEFQGNVAFVGTRAFWRPQDQSPTGQGYHWNTNAETYYLIGDAMGKAMHRLLPSKSEKRNTLP